MVLLYIDDICYNVKYVGIILYYYNTEKQYLTTDLHNTHHNINNITFDDNINYIFNTYMVNIHYNKNLNKIQGFCLGTPIHISYKQNLDSKDSTLSNSDLGSKGCILSNNDLGSKGCILSNLDKMKICLNNQVNKCIQKNYEFITKTQKIQNTKQSNQIDIISNYINKKINKISLSDTNKYINYIIDNSSSTNFYFKVKLPIDYASFLINMCNMVSISKNDLVFGIKKSPIYKKKTKIQQKNKSIELSKREHKMFYHLLEIKKT